MLSLVRDESFLTELDTAWNHTDIDHKKVKDLLVLELKAFPLAMEVARATEEPKKGVKRYLSRWLGRSSTAIGSVKDILDEGLPPLAKGGLIAFQELIDIFKAR